MATPKKKDSAPPTMQYFAAVLRILREHAGLTQEELGERMHYTGPAVSAVETCAKPPTDEFIEAAEKALDASGLLRSAIGFLRLERYPEYFQGFVQLEQEALSVSSYCTQVIDGLMQTEEYARALLRSNYPPFEAEKLEQLVAARMDRKALFDRKPMALTHTILEEDTLRRMIGGPEVMRAQLQHLIACSERPNVTIQVMPLSRAEHAALRGAFTILETPDHTTLVYMESHDEGILISKPHKVNPLAGRYAVIRSQALGPEESVSFIEQLRDEL